MQPEFREACVSPPLLHPVPQHPVHFSGGGEYGNIYAPGPSQVPPQGPFGGGEQAPRFFQDPNTQMGIQVGRSALQYGQEYIGRNMEAYVSVGALQYYFQVSNMYVFKKLLVVLFPWRHRPWSRQILRNDSNGGDAYAPARDDINAPDMYIPIMAITTYDVVYVLVQGLGGNFHPQLLGDVISRTFAVLIVELILLKASTYLLSASSSLLDFVAYTGYKFIGVILTMLASATKMRYLKWATFAYTSTALSFFLLRSLRYVLLPEASSSASTVNPGQRHRRIQFLFVYSFVLQYILMWCLLP